MSFIVINKETLTIALHTSEMRIANEAADLVVPNNASRVAELSNAAFSCFTEYELMIFYKNITGEEISLRPYLELLSAVKFAVEKIPVDTTPYEVFHKWAKTQFPDAPPEAHRALAPDPSPSPSIPSEPILGESGKPQSTTPKEKKEKAPSTPRDENQRPKPGGKTAKVWEIADGEYGRATHDEADLTGETPLDWKKIRTEVFRLCEEAGLNPGMVATQYGRWKKSIPSS